MTTKLTLFTATLVQDSALSVSGFHRETSADQPFALVDGKPTLVGRGLKGAAVAMAQRFFHPLPEAVSEAGESDDDKKEKGRALRRSAWEFADAIVTGAATTGTTASATTVNPKLRAGVGIRHKTGARAGGVLYDREVIPAGTRWQLSFRVDRSYALDDAEFAEAEGILGYVLAKHWAEGRCWLGGGAARGLGWCHIEDLKAYRFDDASYETWVESRRTILPSALSTIPVVDPTRSWCFRTLDVNIAFGEYTPEPSEAAWGLDMFAVGPHDSEQSVQPTGDGQWASPAWAKEAKTPVELVTDRALLMDGGRPLLPGASVRGPLRHAVSRQENAKAGQIVVKDPHLVQGNVGKEDFAGDAFGTVSQSSRILIRDARAEGNWAAAKLHMHAEDEFSAGSYGSAKRDAVRVLQGTFPVRIVVEGATCKEIKPLVDVIDRQVALGALGHLFVGGHKTRGAGAGRWVASPWDNFDVTDVRDRLPPTRPAEPAAHDTNLRRAYFPPPEKEEAWVRTMTGPITGWLTLGEAARLAKAALGENLVAWWCDPTINLDLHTPPATFGTAWPREDEALQVDEVAFYYERAVWRAARTAAGARFVLLQELTSKADDRTTKVSVIHTPARLHGFSQGERPRFSSNQTGRNNVLLREWHDGNEILGFTITKEQP